MKVMNDIEEYKQYEKDLENENETEEKINNRILEDIQKSQEGRDDTINALE